MVFYLKATSPHLQIGEYFEAENAFRAVEVIRSLMHKFGFLVLLDQQEPTHCRGRIYKDRGLELLPVGEVAAVAV
ncbi:hypothetical protein [Desulfonatronum thiodismutans]|uniref:hypothetical protein n=1 Tax=Desulfonatronum thiodismutans TaxID=159290 RepID=UPI0004ABD688|nr:hypothetical protein [Desulfonatronum thiodismutans]